ncbi:MAG: hypothetical protein ACFFBD_06870 [Candidatus Hodarchaeota archaeon]
MSSWLSVRCCPRARAPLTSKIPALKTGRAGRPTIGTKTIPPPPAPSFKPLAIG